MARLLFAGKLRGPARKIWSLYNQDLREMLEDPRTAPRPVARAEA